MTIFEKVDARDAHGIGQQLIARRDRRQLISSALLSVLLAIALQEMVNPVRESVRLHGIVSHTLCLALIFLLTLGRFFIGAQLHMLSFELGRCSGRMWLFDFGVIGTEFLLFIFMGGVCSYESLKQARYGFVTLLMILYGVDILWVTFQFVLHKLERSHFRRRFVPWGWALINSIIVCGTVAARQFSGSYYQPWPLGLLFTLSFIAFAIDVALLDCYDVM